MTSAIGAVWVPQPMSDQAREACLEGLAEDWDDLGDEREQMLARWVHPSWNARPGERDLVWKQYRAAVVLAADLYDETADWGGPELPPDGHQHDRASGFAAANARSLLARLVNGTGER